MTNTGENDMKEEIDVKVGEESLKKDPFIVEMEALIDGLYEEAKKEMGLAS